MANSLTVQTLEDGPRNLVLNIVGALDTSDVAANTDIITPSSLSADDGITATRVRIKKIEYDVEDGLSVNLWWDATTDVLAASLAGRGELRYDTPLLNNGGAGITGKVQLSTSGFGFGDTSYFTVKLHCEKY